MWGPGTRDGRGQELWVVIERHIACLWGHAWTSAACLAQCFLSVVSHNRQTYRQHWRARGAAWASISWDCMLKECRHAPRAERTASASMHHRGGSIGWAGHSSIHLPSDWHTDSRLAYSNPTRFFSFFLFFHLVPRWSRRAHDVPVVGTSRLCLSLPQYASQRAIGLVASPTLPIFARLLAPVILHSPRTPCTPRPSASGKPTQWIPDVVQRCGRGLGGSPLRGGAGGDGIRRPGTAAYRRAVERPISPTTILCANRPPHWYCLSASMSTGVAGGCSRRVLGCGAYRRGRGGATLGAVLGASLTREASSGLPMLAGHHPNRPLCCCTDTMCTRDGRGGSLEPFGARAHPMDSRLFSVTTT